MFASLVLAAALAANDAAPKPLTPEDQIAQLQHQLKVDEIIIATLQQQNANQAMVITRMGAEDAVNRTEKK